MNWAWLTSKFNVTKLRLLHYTCLVYYRYFTYLATHGDKTRFNVELATSEASQCSDLLTQAQHHVITARQIDMEERLVRQKQEDDRAAFKRLQEEERKRLEEERTRTKEELLIKRQEYKEKTKNAMLFSESFSEKKKGSFCFELTISVLWFHILKCIMTT